MVNPPDLGLGHSTALTYAWPDQHTLVYLGWEKYET